MPLTDGSGTVPVQFQYLTPHMDRRAQGQHRLRLPDMLAPRVLATDTVAVESGPELSLSLASIHRLNVWGFGVLI